MPPAAERSAAQPAPAMTLDQFLGAIFSWLASNTRQVVVSTITGAIFGFVLNLALTAFFARGGSLGVIGVIAADPFLSGVISTVFFGLLGYWRAVGSERFWRDVGRIPAILAMLLRHDGGAAWTHLLWGAAVSLLASLVMSPGLAAGLGLSVLALAPTSIGRMVSSLLARAVTSLANAASPARKHPIAGEIAMVVGILGSAAALFIGILVIDGKLQMGAAGACAVLALASGAAAGRKPPPAAMALLALLLGAALVDLLAPAIAWAGVGPSGPPPRVTPDEMGPLLQGGEGTSGRQGNSLFGAAGMLSALMGGLFAPFGFAAGSIIAGLGSGGCWPGSDSPEQAPPPYQPPLSPPVDVRSVGPSSGPDLASDLPSVNIAPEPPTRARMPDPRSDELNDLPQVDAPFTRSVVDAEGDLPDTGAAADGGASRGPAEGVGVRDDTSIDLPDVPGADSAARAATDVPDEDAEAAARRDRLAQIMKNAGDNARLRAIVERAGQRLDQIDLDLLQRLVIEQAAQAGNPDSSSSTQVLEETLAGTLKEGAQVPEAGVELARDAAKAVGKKAGEVGTDVVNAGSDLLNTGSDLGSTLRTYGRLQRLGDAAYEFGDWLMHPKHGIRKTDADIQAAQKSVAGTLIAIGQLTDENQWGEGLERLVRKFGSDALVDATDFRRTLKERLGLAIPGAIDAGFKLDGVANFVELAPEVAKKAGRKARKLVGAAEAGAEGAALDSAAVARPVADRTAPAADGDGPWERRAKMKPADLKDWDVPEATVTQLKADIKAAEDAAKAAKTAERRAAADAKAVRAALKAADPTDLVEIQRLQAEAVQATTAAAAAAQARAAAEAGVTTAKATAKTSFLEKEAALAVNKPLQGSPDAIPDPPGTVSDPPRKAVADAAARQAQARQAAGIAESDVATTASEKAAAQAKYDKLMADPNRDAAATNKAFNDLQDADMKARNAVRDAPAAQAELDEANRALQRARDTRAFDPQEPRRAHRLSAEQAAEAADARKAAEAASVTAKAEFKQAVDTWDANQTPANKDAADAASKKMWDARKTLTDSVTAEAAADAKKLATKPASDARDAADIALRNDLEDKFRRHYNLPSAPGQRLITVGDATEAQYQVYQNGNLTVQRRLNEATYPGLNKPLVGFTAAENAAQPVAVAVDQAAMAARNPGVAVTPAAAPVTYKAQWIDPGDGPLDAGDNWVGINVQDPNSAINRQPPSFVAVAPSDAPMSVRHEIGHGLQGKIREPNSNNVRLGEVVEGLNELHVREVAATETPSPLAGRMNYERQYRWASDMREVVGDQALSAGNLGNKQGVDTLNAAIGARLGAPLGSETATGEAALQQMNALMKEGRFAELKRATDKMRQPPGSTVFDPKRAQEANRLLFNPPPRKKP